MNSLASTPIRVKPFNSNKNGPTSSAADYSTLIQTILKEHLKDDSSIRIDSSAKDEWMSILEGFSEHVLQTFPAPDVALWAAMQEKVRLCGFIMELFERAARRVDTLFEDSDERSVALCQQVKRFYLTISSWSSRSPVNTKAYSPNELKTKTVTALNAIASAFAYTSSQSTVRDKLLDGTLTTLNELLNQIVETKWPMKVRIADLMKSASKNSLEESTEHEIEGAAQCCVLATDLLHLGVLCLDTEWSSTPSLCTYHRRVVALMKRFTELLLDSKSTDLGQLRVASLAMVLKNLLKFYSLNKNGNNVLAAIPSTVLLFRLKEGPSDNWRIADEYLLDIFKSGTYSLQPVHRCRSALELALKEDSIKEGTILIDCVTAAIRSSLKYLSQASLQAMTSILKKTQQRPSVQSLITDIETKLIAENSEIYEIQLGKRKREEDPWRVRIAQLVKPAIFNADGDWTANNDVDDTSFASSILNSLRRKFSEPCYNWSSQQRIEALDALKQLAEIIAYPGSNVGQLPSNDNPLPLALLPTYITVINQLRLGAEKDCPSSVMKISQEALAACIKHQLQMPSKGKLSTVLTSIIVGFRDENRSVRLVAGRALTELVGFYARKGRHSSEQLDEVFEWMITSLDRESDSMAEILLITLGSLGKVADQEVLGRSLMCLFTQLDKRNALMRGLTYMQLQALAKCSGKTPYALIAPHMQQLSNYVVSVMSMQTNTLLETCRLLSLSSNDFLTITLPYTMPQLFASRNLSAIEAISNQLDKPAPSLFFDTSADVLARIFLLEGDDETEMSLAFTVDVLSRSSKTKKISLTSIIKSWVIPLLGKLIIALGDQDEQKTRNANRAIEKLILAAVEPSERPPPDVQPDTAGFLRGYMLGIVANLSDMLQDVQSRKSDESKQKVLRGLNAFVTAVGSSINAIAPQIMATLQTTVTSPTLSITALQTWHNFLTNLSMKDLGPHVGPTTASLVNIWPALNEDGKSFAKLCIKYILNDAFEELGDYVDDIADFSRILELSKSCKRIQALRESRTLKDRLNRVLDRLSSDNDTVVLQALEELRKCMLTSHADYIKGLASGDVFDPAVGDIMQALLSVACRDGDSIEELRLLSFECIGILGAIDPDRFDMTFQDDSMVVLSNFTEENESMQFALHLVQNTLVGAFRSTSDIKYQTHLAFAIQELMKFCKFTPELTRPGTSVPLKVRQRWNSLPKLVLETITPLLEARFSVNSTSDNEEVEHPIYSHEVTYREWMQQWTAFLITRVNGEIAKTLFDAFRMTIRNKDVSVARQLLPHLVLNILISGTADDNQKIKSEVIAVLQDQLEQVKKSSADKRLLSAQAIFMLMDHLNKWIRKMRQEISSKRNESRRARQTSALHENELYVTQVDSILASIDQILIAEAAFQCKAYARSLMNFEKQIVLLRGSDSTRERLQTYYNRLHEIYSHLDEPDGMEGVSAFISVNSIEHQIRLNESTGKWTSAQSCWELRLQQSPDNLEHHLGLLRCLRNLGHYDSLRTHIQGVLTRNPQWENALEGFRVEGAWICGDWDAVQELINRCNDDTWEMAVARPLLFLRSSQVSNFSSAVSATRLQLGRPITAAGEKGYRRAYDAVLKLHLVRDIETIRDALMNLPNSSMNASLLSDLFSSLSHRLESTQPTFRMREPILSMHRTAFSISQVSESMFGKAVGLAWLESAKIARKARHWQTAYSAVLQAQECQAPYTFFQSAKLVKASGEPLRALYDLDNALQTEDERRLLAISQGVKDSSENVFAGRGSLKQLEVKANLLRARWMKESERFEVSTVVRDFATLTKRFPEYESTYFHAGHYQDECYHNLNAAEKKSRGSRMNLYTVRMYAQAIRLGSKYAYQTIPRLLTIWLDMGEDKIHQNSDSFNDINNEIGAAIKHTPVYKWLTAFPQIVSRVDHENKAVYQTLSQLISAVLREHPQQSLWLFMSVVKSTKSRRERRGRSILEQLSYNPVNSQTGLPRFITHAVSMATELLRLCDYPIKDDATRVLSMGRDFPALYRLAPSSLIIPLQESMTVTLPPNSSSQSTHQPFPPDAPTIQGFYDEVDVMRSLAKPRKITILGSNGKIYMFLGKPKDDLRKDARLMDFNSIINKLLKTNSESRRRQLHIRTYSVVTLNEECGFIQWVPNTTPIRPVLLKYYAAKGIEAWGKEMTVNFTKIKESTDKEAAKIFQEKVLAVLPPVFHEWFLDTFAEPTAWLSSRLAYGRTAAVMSMVGFILGLGDRHLENILLDVSSGDAIHVDFNCLFDKGKSLEVPERIPFRLTHNMVNALGVTGVEGVFRKAAELTMQLLRDNKDVLMSVLDAFIHDPLVEWEDEKRRMERQARKDGDVNAVRESTDLRHLAKNALIPIERKLKGYYARDLDRNNRRDKEITTSNLVQMLIEEATDLRNLSKMYPGWAPHH